VALKELLPIFSRDLSRRSDQAEWLDEPNLDPDELMGVLYHLARFNRVMLGHHPILNWLQRAVIADRKQQPFSLVDVGCGYGDLLRAIRRWANRRGLPIALRGLDSNPETICIARKATDEEDRIDFEIADIFQYRPIAPVDLIVSSLVAHHFSDRAIVDFLRWMEATARRGWLICDLQRHAVPYYLIGVAGALAGVHPVVIHDGRISIARALTRSEWRERLQTAGLASEGIRIRWFMFRYLVGRLR
jgi:SAM-dependent methyltransferase